MPRSIPPDAGDRSAPASIRFLPLSLDGRLGFVGVPRLGLDPRSRAALEAELDRLARSARVRSWVTVSVSAPPEPADLGPDCRARNIGFSRYRLLDPEDRAGLDDRSGGLAPLLERLGEEINAGTTVVVASADHAAPLVAAAFLAEQGWPVPRALAVVRQLGGPGCLGDLKHLDGWLPLEPEPASAPSVAAVRVPAPLERSVPPPVERSGPQPVERAGPPPVERAVPPPSEGGAVPTLGLRAAKLAYRATPTARPEPSPGPSEPPLPAEPEPAAETHPIAKAPDRPVWGMRGLSPKESWCVGATLGAALGDALGAPLEAETDRAQLEARFGADGPSAPLRRWEQSAATSEETQHLVLALETMLEARQRGFPVDTALERLARRVAAWAEAPEGGHREPDPVTRTAAARLGAGTPWPEAGQAANVGSTPLLRAGVAGLVFVAEPRDAGRWGAALSRVTHRGEETVGAAAAIAVGVAWLARGERLRDAAAAMVGAACRFSPAAAVRLAGALEAADAGTPPAVASVRLGSPSALDTLAMALFSASRHPDDFERAVRESCMTSGDSDGAAACAGMLLGARLGAGGLPRTWVASLERAESLEALALALAACP